MPKSTRGNTLNSVAILGPPSPLIERLTRLLADVVTDSDCDACLTVLYANSRIQRVELLSGRSPALQRYDGGGFTDLRPVFEYAKTMHPLPAAVIYLTDGIGPAPQQMEFPTLWVLTGAGEKPVPWGIEIRLEV